MFYFILIFLVSLSPCPKASLINTASGIEYLLYTEDVFLESFDLYFQEQEAQLNHLKT